MYVCGPTTYNYIHLGNARPLTVFDTIRRYLAYRGYQVVYVQNFTDIDDKIINRAKEEDIAPQDLAEKYVAAYFADADALGVKRADVHPRVSEHLPEIIEMVAALIKKGYAYEVAGDVYYEVARFAGYGKLSGRSLDDLLAGARVEVDARKKSPMDFALWKAAKPGEPAWDSPWGPGRPGWHIECSAMALKYLGFDFDIHGGGFDLIFPHHENEVAQAEAYGDGRPFARYWMHNGFITVNQEKMSKSLGNFFILRDILAKYPGDVVRFYLLSTHYRSPLDFDDTKLDMSWRGLERLKNAYRLAQETLKAAAPVNGGPEPTGAGLDLARRVQEVKEAFIEAMDDDFNTALGIAALFDLAKEINLAVNNPDPIRDEAYYRALSQATQLMSELGGDVLGILTETAGAEDDKLIEALIQLTVAVRQEARQAKNWAAADLVRDKLKTVGLVLEDTPQGVRVQRDGSGEILDELLSLLVELRRLAKQKKDWAAADRLRDELKRLGIVLEDTPGGTRWKIEAGR